jgi:hypothetical protein
MSRLKRVNRQDTEEGWGQKRRNEIREERRRDEMR